MELNQLAIRWLNVTSDDARRGARNVPGNTIITPQMGLEACRELANVKS